jgi:CubicO group peptidase (beta-lactamase class C family)
LTKVASLSRYLARRSLLLCGACLLLSALVASTQAQPSRETIEQLGFDPERLSRITDFVARDIAAQKIAGAVTLVARHGEIVHLEAQGVFGVDDSRPMTEDALFRIFSMTKPITTVAAMILYEEGAFHLGDPVAQYLPELGEMRLPEEDPSAPPAYRFTIEQLLTHSAGLTNGWHTDHPTEQAYRDADLYRSADLNEFIERLGRLPLRFVPGSRYHYSVATDVLGALVERISGQTLEQFFVTRIFQPLGMTDTFFNVPDSHLDRLAANHFWNPETGRIVAPPENMRLPAQGVTLFSGGGGLISSTRDYWLFCEMLRQGGSLNGARILGPKTVQYMTMAHLTPAVRNEGADEYPASHLYPGQSFGFGAGVITDPSQSQVISSLGEYSWGGIANTKFWIDPQEDLVAILMTQVMGAPYSDALRYDMKVATYQALSHISDGR